MGRRVRRRPCQAERARREGGRRPGQRRISAYDSQRGGVGVLGRLSGSRVVNKPARRLALAVTTPHA